MGEQSIWGLSLADWTVIALYFTAVIGVAFRAARLVKNREDFFIGGRRFGKLIQTFAAFGQATSVENVTATTTAVNANGAAGIWALMAGALVDLPIFWMTSVWYRRLRILTLADFFEERYGSRWMAGFYAVCQMMFYVLVAGIGFTAMGKTVAAIAAKPESALTVVERAEYTLAVEREKLESADFALLNTNQQLRLRELQRLNPHKEFSRIDEQWLIIAVATVTFLYASAGGLLGAVLVDLIQGTFILILSVLLVPFAIGRVNQLHGTQGLLGVFETMHRVLPASYLELWGSPGLQEFTWYWIVSFAVLMVMNVAVQANQLTACGSARDEYTARYGFVSGILLKRYSNLLWGFMALLTVVLYGGTVSDPDYVWGHATRDLLGPVGFGLVGLMVACLMAALMANKSSMMLTASGLVTCNLYRPLFPNRSERHYIRAGRIFNALYMAAAVYIATQFSSVFNLLKAVMMFNCVLAASFWLGMTWRRANRWGAWCSMGVMFVATVLLPFGLPLIPGVRTAAGLQKSTRAVPVTRTYVASEMDCQERQQAIDRWEKQHVEGKPSPDRPQPLQLGKPFLKTRLLKSHSIFWSDGLKNEGGVMTGKGYLKVDLVLLDWLGVNLSANSYSVNETITFLFRIIVPIAILLLVSRLTAPEDPTRLRLFFGKMRTPVRGSAADDAREIALTLADPGRFDHRRLLPGSQWEFRKWEREDWVGVIWSALGALGVVVLLTLMVRLGGS